MSNIKDYSKLEDKVNLLYECIRKEGGIVDFDWCTSLLYPYHLHFDDNNTRYRSASLIAFLGLLTEWEDGSGFPFYRTKKELHDCHDFEKYMDALLQRQSEIEREFPNIFYSIVITLRWLIHHKDLRGTFTYIDEQKVSRYLTNVKSIEIKESKEVFRMAFEEAAIFN
ncbi:hypothetical protein ACFQI7_27705 [Paenibacillus allorhizosphaerae]|uniref:hypothetical protein n=1 Tax=Paenibacillus allorhizosphaerae TaxID=2849866 RepID=UPI001C40773B|nr:hypothetical protein [Paenibacillus allorhizosphaerae]